ncbi:MAG: peptidoglycan-binding protein [Christensenellales bacterium]
MKRILALITGVMILLSLLTPVLGAQSQPAYPTLGQGARGEEVIQLQERLALLGFLRGNTDGIYGQQTADAVQAAQQYLKKEGHSLAADGVAGPQTLALLYDDLAVGSLLDAKMGDSGSKVTVLQTRLYDLNLLSDRPDGAFGPRTEEALKKLQAILVAGGVSGVEINGVADKATRDALAGDMASLGIVAPAFFDDSNPQGLEPAYLYARSAILLDTHSGQTLFEKDADTRRYPASTTKIMTLLVALEKGDLDRAVTLPQATGDVPKDSSLVPVYPGEKMTLRDLLYGLMIRSGNDAANAIAVIVLGSVPRFVEEMNRKARQLGMKDTHFANPHGYHHKEHYTTARDLATLTRHAMSNNAFLPIAASLAYTLPPTSRREALEITTNTELLMPETPHYYPGAYGIKSGFTRAAGFCYVGAAGKEGRQLLAVVLDCRTRGMAWDDMKRLFNYGFTK